MAIDCNLPHKFAKQNAKRKLMDEGLIDKFNEILDYPKLLKRIGEFNDFADRQYGIKAKFVQVDDVHGTNKVVFNEAAFRAVDVLKGKVPDYAHDLNTSAYLNQVRPDYSPNPFNSDDETIPRTGLTGIVNLKENLLTRAKKQLTDLNPLIEQAKGNASEYNRLINQRTELRDYIFGNDSKGIQGLENEIKEIGDIDSRAPEIIAPYIEKELQRLDGLIKTSDPSNLAEAKTIIDFTKSMADFNIVNILRNPNGHPIYDTSELYDEDNNFLLAPSMTKYFKDWAITAEWYNDELDKQNKNVIEQTVNENPKVKNMYEDRKFNYADLISSKTGLKDINWVDMMLMDVSSGIFSSNGIMPQVVKMNVDDILEKHLSWSKSVEHGANELEDGLNKELIRLGYTQDRLGFIGIHKPSYDIFRQKLPDDIQSNNNFAQKYSYTYLDKYDDMQHKFENDLRKAYTNIEPTTKSLYFKNAFDARNRWLRKNTLLVDPSLLSRITDNPEFQDLRGNFNHTPEEIKAHEDQIKSIVGENYYNKLMDSQEKKVGDYMIQAKNYQQMLLDKEGITDPEQLPQSAKDQFIIWKAQNSPFLATDYLRTNLPVRVNTNDYHSNFDYSDHIPLKYDQTGKDLNHYDKNYEIIENNPTLLGFHEFMTNTLKEMYSKFDYDQQQELSLGSVPLMERKRGEIFMDKNLSFFQAISKVFRDWWDKFKGGFGIRVQDQFNYAKINPNTGLPDYKVNDSFIKQNLKGIQDLFKVKSTKFLNEFNRFDHLMYSKIPKLDGLNKFTSLPTKSIDSYTLDLINKFTGKEYSLGDLNSQYGDFTPIGKIIYQNAQHEIAQNKSFDLPTILKYFSHLTAQYAARREALPLAELMKSHYESIKNQVTQNTNDPIINYKDGNNQLNGLRTNANKQFDNWFERVILGKQGLVKHFGIMKAGDKLTPEENQNFLNKFFSGIANATNFDGKIYDTQEKKVLAQIEEAQKGLGSSEEDQKTYNELQNIKENLGKDAALSATLSSVLMFTRFKMLAYNLSSGINNFIDGQVANTISAASGNYFKPEHLYEVTPGDMFRSDLMKQVNPGLMSEKVAKAYWIARKMDIFQDNTNELQKASSDSPVSNLNKFAMYYNMGKSEQYNQMPVVVATLKSHELTGVNGEKSNVWDALHGEYNSEIKQWEVALKPEFATEENKKSWEEFNGQDYFNYKTRARQVIRDTHSHGLDPTAGMMAKSSILGQALTMFKTFLPREYYKRYAVEQDNIAAGIQGFKGRYRSHTGTTAAIQGGISGGLLFGLPGFVGGSALGAILGSKYGADTMMDTLSQTLEVNKILFKKLMGMPVNPISRMLTGKNLIDTNVPEELNNKFKFSQQDFANFKANMQSMSVQIAYLGLLFLTKAIFWDDKDKSNSLSRETHNLIANRLLQLSGTANLYLNPVETGSTVLAIPTLQVFKNIGTTLGAVDKAMKGEDTLISGPNAGHSRLMGDLRKDFVPGIGSAPWAGLQSQMQKQFTPSPLDDYFHNDETKTKEQIKEAKSARRAVLEQQLEEQIPDEDERHAAILKILNKEFPKAKSTHHHIALYSVTD